MDTKPYYFIRYEWYSRIVLSKLAEDWAEEFVIEDRPMPSAKIDASPYKYERESLKVTASSLSAFLYPYKAVLFQRKVSPFTKKDQKLRSLILEMYPHNKVGIFALTSYKEPKFVLIEE